MDTFFYLLLLSTMLITTFLLITKNVKVKNNIDTFLTTTFSYNEPLDNKKRINYVIDNNSTNTLYITVNKQLEYIQICNVNEYLEETNVIFEKNNLRNYKNFSFKYTLSKTFPTIQINLKVRKGSIHSYVPLYNEKENTFEFDKII